MHKYKVIAFYLLIIMVLGACNAKKKVSESFINIERESISYALPSKNTLVVSELCDTLNVKSPATFEIDNGAGVTIVSIKDNQLTVDVESDTIYKERISEKIVVKETKKEVIKFRWAKITWFFLACMIVFIILPIIPRTINMVIRKLLFGFLPI